MKKRTFAQSYHQNSRRKTSNNRVQILSETTRDFVRAGQSIGSPRRAIEELVRNAIIHGRANEVIVTIGTAKSEVGGSSSSTFLEVKDNGVGMNSVACRDFIGTQHCSSEVIHQDRIHTGTAQIQPGGWRGESLKALAALSVDFRVETTCIDQRSQKNWIDVSREHRTRCNLLSAPSKPRRTMSHSTLTDVNAISLQRSKEGGPTITSEKIVRDGKMFAFRSISSKKQSGTSVQLYGLFHKNQVRLRHHQIMKLGNSSTDPSDHLNVAQACSVIQVLALIFPTVTMKLYQTASTHQPDFVCLRPGFLDDDSGLYGDSPPPSFVLKALKARFFQFCRLQGAGKDAVIDVSYKENCPSRESERTEMSSLNLDWTKSARATVASYPQKLTSLQQRTLNTKQTSQRTGYSEQDWSIMGVMFQRQSNGEVKEECRNRSRHHELIFVNNRPMKKCTVLNDLIQKLCCTHTSDGDSVWRYLFHISCPPKEVDLVVDEIKSYSMVCQKDRLLLNMHNAISAAFAENSSIIDERKGMSTSLDLRRNQHSTVKEDKSNNSTPKPSNVTALPSKSLYHSSRIVSGRSKVQVRLNAEEQSLIDNTATKIRIASPFSDAFSNVKKLSDSTFDNAFIPGSISKAVPSKTYPILKHSIEKEPKTYQLKEPLDNGMTWTRKRLKALDTEIKSLTGANTSSRPIKLSRDALSRAQFISQVDAKFIIVNMDGIICAIDQHAADERVCLERLENALRSNILSQHDETNEKCFSLSKLKNIKLSNIIKAIPVENVRPLPLSPKQLAIITSNKVELRKWKFDFTIDEESAYVQIDTVPRIIEKVATPRDFLQFVQAIGNRALCPSMIQPHFVKRVLASYACRYSIMFGDVLEKETCEELIKSLAKCDLNFICAHGRPSIVPLVDMNSSLVEGEETRSPHANSHTTVNYSNKEEYIPLRFRKNR